MAPENTRKQRWSAAYVALMSRLRGNWPIEESRFDAALQNFYVLWQEVGEMRFEAAVTGIISGSAYQYFPNIAEFRGFLPPVRNQYCGHCVDGFVYDDEPDNHGNKQVKFCECAGGVERAKRLKIHRISV